MSIENRTAALIESDRIATEAIERRVAAGDAPTWDAASYEWIVHAEDRKCPCCSHDTEGCWYCREAENETEDEDETETEIEIPGQIEIWPREDY